VKVGPSERERMCPHCGQVVAPDRVRRCDKCGKDLAVPPDADAGPPPDNGRLRTFAGCFLTLVILFLAFVVWASLMARIG
jgi:hypothetical protein